MKNVRRTPEETSAYIQTRRAEIRAKKATNPNRISSGLVSRDAKPIPAPHREHQRDMGAQGGLSKSPAKVSASRANLVLARAVSAEIRSGRVADPKMQTFRHPKTPAERSRAYRVRQAELGNSEEKAKQ